MKKQRSEFFKGYMLGVLVMMLAFLFATCNVANAQEKADSTHYRMFIADRDRFIEQQETVRSKNMYLQLQGAITLLNMYIANEENKFKFQLDRK